MAKKKTEDTSVTIDNDGIKTYEVSLPHLPAMVIGAKSETEAVEIYNSFMGVRETIHRHIINVLH